MKHHPVSASEPIGKSGVTLVEVVVVLSIIALLMSLLLPAIQWTRERARRVQCKSRLAQLSLAFQSYHSDHNCFPTERYPHQRMLPYLGFVTLYQEIDPDLDHIYCTGYIPPVEPWPAYGLSLFVCPTDPVASSNLGHSSYQLNLGSNYQRYRENGLRLPETFPRQFTKMSDITDGLGATACMAEHLIERTAHYPADVLQDPLRMLWHTAAPMPLPTQLDQFADECQGANLAPLCLFHLNASRWLFYPGGYNHVLTPNTKPMHTAQCRAPTGIQK